MSLSDAIGQIDQIVQWEQQIADPATLSQASSTGGTAITADTSSTSAGSTSAGASFASALAQAQEQGGTAALSTLDPTAVGGATGALDPGSSSASSLLGASGSSASSLLGATGSSALGATGSTTGTAALLSGGDSQLLAALSAAGGAQGSGTVAAAGASDPRIQAMVQEADSLVGKPYVWGGGHGGWGPQSGYDCSGFVSAVLHAGGYLSTPQDTTTLPSAPGIESGPGQYVTIYDRDGAGQEGHVIIDINGQFYESGGEHGTWGGGGGVSKISTPSAEYLSTFNQILHPAGL